MKILMTLSFFLFLGLFGIHLSSGNESLKCYGCHPTDVKSSCKNFWKASEDERKAAFVMQCPPESTACVRSFRRSIDSASESSSTEEEQEQEEADLNNILGVELENMEVLNCLTPSEFPHPVEMNDCVSIVDPDEKHENVICACDTGDLCVPNGGSELVGKASLLGLSLIAVLVGFVKLG